METVIRVAVIFVIVMVGLRITGKRELSELSPQDLVLLLLIPELATQAMSRDDYSITNALIGISTLLGLVFLNSLLGYRFQSYRKLMEGEPQVLFHDGKFQRDTLHRERIDADEIVAEARSHGFESLDQVKWAILEPDGKITCIPYGEIPVRKDPKQRKVA